MKPAFEKASITPTSMFAHTFAHPVWENPYIQDYIAFLDTKTYKSMLAIPAFARKWRGKLMQLRAQSNLIVRIEFEDRVEYRLCGELHSVYDRPAVIYANGGQEWFRHGKIHRDGMPAVILSDGDQYWYRRGKQHRDNFTAVIGANGDQYWFWKGKLHRDGMPAKIYANGNQEWYWHGKLHLDGDPVVAIFSNGKLQVQNGFTALESQHSRPFN